jgi:AraC-like DNA-binding protein/ligand-binding sensor protein
MIDDHKQLIEALQHSTLFQDYQRSFSEATGLPVVLRAVECWQLPFHGHRRENEFCSLIAQRSRTSACCLQVQQELADRSMEGPGTTVCPFGMTDSAVPVRVGERIVGFLQTGQVFRRRPTERQFQQVLKLARSWGLEVEEGVFRRAFFSGKVLEGKQHEHILSLLAIFAQHLSLISNQILVQQRSLEPPVITKAKEYIAAHQTDDLTLSQVAKAVNTSTFYFCKMFKKVTGLNFTDYVSRLRVERARNLLLNKNLRVSEIAYEVGFQSLTHFNRVFKRILGVSPTQYRSRLPLR